jgi:hypothetical protein
MQFNSSPKKYTEQLIDFMWKKKMGRINIKGSPIPPVACTIM